MLLKIILSINLAHYIFKKTCTGQATHIKFAHEFSKDAKESLGGGDLAILAEEGGHPTEFLHRSLLQRLQRLNSRMTVLQKTLHTTRLRQYTHIFLFNLYTVAPNDNTHHIPEEHGVCLTILEKTMIKYIDIFCAEIY